MMKRIMITILAISALQANVFAADGVTSKKRSATDAGLLELKRELQEAETKIATRSQVAEILRLKQLIEDLEEANARLRHTLTGANDGEVREILLQIEANNGKSATLEEQLTSMTLLLEDGSADDILIDELPVTNLNAYKEFLKAKLELSRLQKELSNEVSLETILAAKIAAQSSGLVGQAIQAGGWTAWAGSLVQSVVDRFTGTKAALTTTQGRIAALKEEIGARGSLLGVLKSAACPVAAACEPVIKAARHSGDAGV